MKQRIVTANDATYGPHTISIQGMVESTYTSNKPASRQQVLNALGNFFKRSSRLISSARKQNRETINRLKRFNRERNG
ncbi:MAG: hypothetical protein JWL85_965 [Candidatus Saccharibacteria bacterium]|nr:hypothetical protein [Candidatus Saccharibacteria bacterium]